MWKNRTDRSHPHAQTRKPADRGRSHPNKEPVGASRLRRPHRERPSIAQDPARVRRRRCWRRRCAARQQPERPCQRRGSRLAGHVVDSPADHPSHDRRPSRRRSRGRLRPTLAAAIVRCCCRIDHPRPERRVRLSARADAGASPRASTRAGRAATPTIRSRARTSLRAQGAARPVWRSQHRRRSEPPSPTSSGLGVVEYGLVAEVDSR